MPRTKSTHASRNAARRGYYQHQQNVAALSQLVEDHAQHIRGLLGHPGTDDSSLKLAITEFREVRRVIDRTLGDETPMALETRCNQVHNPLIMELLRRAGDDSEMRATALGFPLDCVAPSKRTVTSVPERRVSAMKPREPRYPHVDSYPMVLWRQHSGVSRAEHMRILRFRGFDPLAS